MSKAEIIAKLKKGIDSGHVTGDNLTKMKAKLAELEAEESQEPIEKQEAKSKSQEPNAPNAPKVKKKFKELSQERKIECHDILDKAIEAIKALKTAESTNKTQESRAKSHEKHKPKKASELLSGGIVSALRRVIRPELTKDKVAKIKVDKLEVASTEFKQALRTCRQAFGSISTDSDKMIKDFEKEMESMIQLVKDKQADVK